MEAILTSSHDNGSDTTNGQDKCQDNLKNWERNEISEDPYHGSVGYQHACTRVGLAKKAKFLQMQLRTQERTRKNTTEIADECISYECGILQTLERRNCS
jgi:hypothetical protein